jgi:hypothetical protein
VSFGDFTNGVAGPYYIGEGGVYAWLDARLAWWREWVAADAAGDPARVARAREAAEALRDLLPLRYAVEPFNLELTLDPAALQGFDHLNETAARGDLSGIDAWLRRNAPGE